MGRFSYTAREVCESDHVVGQYTIRLGDIAAMNYASREESLAHFDLHHGEGEEENPLAGLLGLAGGQKLSAQAMQAAREEARREAREAITAKALVQLAGSDRWFRVHPEDYPGLKTAWEAWLDEFGAGA